MLLKFVSKKVSLNFKKYIFITLKLTFKIILFFLIQLPRHHKHVIEVDTVKNVIKMTSENLIQISNPRRPILKRSVSVTHITPQSLAGLTLRDAKSFTGNMEEVKSAHGKFMEKVVRVFSTRLRLFKLVFVGDR